MKMCAMMRVPSFAVFLWAILLLETGDVISFTLQPHLIHHRQPLYSSAPTIDDYEYIPPDDAKTSRDSLPNDMSLLTSAYPPSTPSGLRGEAVRSAIRSSRCIGWSFSHDEGSTANHPLASGLLRVVGKGCVPFLNNKLSQSFPQSKDASGTFKEGALLTSKGAIIDNLGVAIVNPGEAYVWTSPGHSSHDLCERLNKYIFPLDEVALKDCCSSDNGSLEYSFALASLRLENVQRVFDEWILPKLEVDGKIQLPKHDECGRVALDNSDSSSASLSLLILPTVSLDPCAAVGCTFLFLRNGQGEDSNSSNLGKEIWSTLVDESNEEGPIAIGSLEWETLRIESAVPRFGYEMTAGSTETTSTSSTTTPPKPASPLELHFQRLIDLEKGCYMGQEGIASVMKNSRGPPRTLYQIEWHDDFNLYDYQSEEQASKNDNDTRLPQRGDVLYVLGSNEQIPVGTVTSVAEPGGTGEALTLGLALIRRSDGILSKMKKLDLEIQEPSPSDDDAIIDATRTTDPLDGLEVIIGDSYTIGTLRTVPSRRGPNFHLFDDQAKSTRVSEISLGNGATTAQLYEPASPIPSSSTAAAKIATEESSPPIDVDTVEELIDEAVESSEQEEDELLLLKQAKEEAAQAKAKAEAAAAEAKRKAEKMKLLQERAAQVMAARRKGGNGTKNA